LPVPAALLLPPSAVLRYANLRPVGRCQRRQEAAKNHSVRLSLYSSIVPDFSDRTNSTVTSVLLVVVNHEVFNVAQTRTIKPATTVAAFLNSIEISRKRADAKKIAAIDA